MRNVHTVTAVNEEVDKTAKDSTRLPTAVTLHSPRSDVKLLLKYQLLSRLERKIGEKNFSKKISTKRL